MRRKRSKPTHNCPEHFADSVLSALELAEQLRAAGEYDLFRGQRHTFPIQPSIFRSGVDRQDAAKKLNSFATWAHGTRDLASLHGNSDALLAVAQHYGLKTPLLDFTRSPRVAAFFATDGGTDGDTGTIICLSRSRFIASWADINDRYAKESGSRLTEIIDIDVRNLWRLQAQEGVFLRCHVEPNWLEMFSCFLHIYFPQNSGTLIEPKEVIYPSSKSHLEVLLDQFFLIDSYPERGTRLTELFGSAISVPEDSITREIKTYYKSQRVPTPNESWRTSFAHSWMREPDERYRDHGPVGRAQLRWPTVSTPHEFEAAVKQQCESALGLAPEGDIKPRLAWKVVNDSDEELYVDPEGITTDKDGEFTRFSIADMLDAIYSGMRYLPYSRSQIARAMVRYLVMLRFGVYEVIHDCEGVEFSGAGVRGRGFASRANIFASLRDDFLELIDPAKLDVNGKLSTSEVLLVARDIKGSFEFERFLHMFVEDLIPSQAVVAVEGLVIGVNPMRVEVFGES